MLHTHTARILRLSLSCLWLQRQQLASLQIKARLTAAANGSMGVRRCASQVAVHLWRDALAVRASGALQLSCVDETSLSTETVLATSQFSLALERSTKEVGNVRFQANMRAPVP